MKKVPLIIGLILLFLQLGIYAGGGFRIPSFDNRGDLLNSIARFTGFIIGYNLLGLIGLFLILYAREKKVNLNHSTTDKN